MDSTVNDRELAERLAHVSDLIWAGLKILVAGRLHQLRRLILRWLRYSPPAEVVVAPPAEPVPIAEPESPPLADCLVDCEFRDQIHCEGGHLINAAGIPYGRCPSCDGAGRLVVTNHEGAARFYA